MDFMDHGDIRSLLDQIDVDDSMLHEAAQIADLHTDGDVTPEAIPISQPRVDTSIPASPYLNPK